jgi:hypothetical protein
MLIELALWATVGALLNAVGYSWDSWQFWCFLGTYWAVSVLSRQRGRIEGMIDYLEMSEKDQAKVKRALEQAKEEVND